MWGASRDRSKARQYTDNRYECSCSRFSIQYKAVGLYDLWEVKGSICRLLLCGKSESALVVGLLHTVFPFSEEAWEISIIANNGAAGAFYQCPGYLEHFGTLGVGSRVRLRYFGYGDLQTMRLPGPSTPDLPTGFSTRSLCRWHGRGRVRDQGYDLGTVGAFDNYQYSFRGSLQ